MDTVNLHQSENATKPRQLANDKLEVIKQHVEELVVLRDELTLLVNFCGARESGCPILEKSDGKTNNATSPRRPSQRPNCSRI